MPAIVVPRNRLLVLALVVLLAGFAWEATHTGSEAAPTSARTTHYPYAGTITFHGLHAGHTQILAFDAGGTSGGGTFSADDTTVVLDSSTLDPDLLKALTTGAIVDKVTVTLLRPETQETQQEWDFTHVGINKVRTSQTGSARLPQVTVAFRYGRVKLRAGSAGFCYDVSAVKAC